MKMNKDLLKKMKAPMGQSKKDPMMEMDDGEMELELDLGSEVAPESEGEPEMDMEEMPESPLAQAEDDELVQELEARGFKVQKPAGAKASGSKYDAPEA